MAPKILSLFEGFGVELEYMIVNANTLAIEPIADRLLEQLAGEKASDYAEDGMGWSNELVMHLIELKNEDPVASIDGLEHHFNKQIQRTNTLLEKHDCFLMSSGAHPFMIPQRETVVWPHENQEIYNSYNRIFDCKNHGWSNLQSTHLNISFATDEEFGRLHAAIRLILPVIPALCASTPVLEGHICGTCDTRLEIYRTNQKKIPSLSGKVIPEAVFTPADYKQQILQRLYRDIAAYDPEGILQNEWLNSRGAIARFVRNAFEIRVIDNQECPASDIALCSLIIAALKALVSERWVSYEQQRAWHEDNLVPIFLSCIRQASMAQISDPNYLKVFGLNSRKSITGHKLWQYLAEQLLNEEQINNRFLRNFFSQGTLAERILSALPSKPAHSQIVAVYRDLASCLKSGEPFSHAH